MPKYKLSFYRTTNEHAEQIVEANSEEQAGEIATKMLDEIGTIDWTVGESQSEFDIDEATPEGNNDKA